MEEISLRELIEVLLKRKKIIAGITLACMIISAIASWFLLKPVYESKTTFTVKPIVIKSGIKTSSDIMLGGDLSTLDSIIELDNKMIGTILNQVNYPSLSIDEIVKRMGSTGYMSKVLKDCGIDTENDKNIKVEYDAKTNLILLSVKFSDAENTLKIKDTIIKNLPVYVTEEVTSQIDSTYSTIDTGKEREKTNLNNWKKKLNDFTVSVGGSDKLASLPDEKNTQYQELKDNVTISNQSIEGYLLVERELESIKTLDYGKMIDMHVISEDKLPLSPVSPKKNLNVAIATVLGLMLGVFCAFFMEYWKKSGISAKNAEGN